MLPPRDAIDEIEVCRAVRATGAAGGPIDVLCPVTDGLADLGPVEGTLTAFDGVPVRETVVLDAADKGFVGDLAGDRVKLVILV